MDGEYRVWASVEPHTLHLYLYQHGLGILNNNTFPCKGRIQIHILIAYKDWRKK
jgi:hypothetical protein